MIKINLLPPELRKRTTSINPMMVVPALEIAACIAILLLGAYVAYVKIPAANAINDAKAQELSDKTAQAAKIQEDTDKITDYQTTQDMLQSMLGRKTYWAHTLDDFVNLLASNFPGGFTVRCLDLEVTHAGAGEQTSHKGDVITYSFRGKFQLVGDQNGTSGDYIRDMFKQIGTSAFWKDNNFIDKPERSYFGDTPQFNPAIGKLIIPLDLEFHRVHTIAKAGG